MLKVEQLNAWYDHSHVIQGLSFEVQRGEIVTLMGRNGAGKTSTLRTIMGLLGKCKGQVTFDGQELLGQPPHTRYHLGLAYVPEERRIVAGLTVLENLQLGLVASSRRGEMSAMVDEIAQTFPRLKERLQQDGTSLSGGEQQMLAIARTLMTQPRLLLLDEPCEGIAPVLVESIRDALLALKAGGMAMLVAEQNQLLAASADRTVRLVAGKVSAS